MWLILLDRSDSMGRSFQGEHGFAGRTRATEATIKLDAAKQAIAEHLRGLGAPTRVVLIAFNAKAAVIYDGTSEAHDAIATVLADIQAQGGTSIASALDLARITVEGAHAERLFRALVVTDGEDDLPTAQAAATDLAKLGVAIDVALIDPTEKGEPVARAIAQNGAVSAVASAADLLEEVGRAKAAQESDRAAVEELFERHKEERARLAEENPVEERLAFTAAYPSQIPADRDRWQPLTVYLHLAGLQDEVARAVRETSGLSAATMSHAQAARGVARGTLLTLTPRIQGLDVNPPSATVAWFEDVQEVRFRIRPRDGMAGQSAFGAVEVALESLPIAHLGVAINVAVGNSGSRGAEGAVAQAGLYQDVFASYSSKDRDIVEACRAVYWGLGIQLAIDKRTLRAGQEWDPALRTIIEGSDLFQLFWSEAASQSKPVQAEWEFALVQTPAKGQGFIRPLVWETPTPKIPGALKHLHFAPLDLGALSRLSRIPVSRGTASPPRERSSDAVVRVPVTVVPLIGGVAPQLVQAVRSDLSDIVQFIERTTALRYYPVPTLLVDEHVVQTVRAEETVDLGAADPHWVDLASALQEFLLSVDLQFHVHGLVPGKRGDMSHEAYAERFGAGRIMSMDQFESLRRICEGFPRLSDVLMLEMRAAQRKVGALIDRPGLDLDLAEFIPLALELCAAAIIGNDPDRHISVKDHTWQPEEIKLAPDLQGPFVAAGGSVASSKPLTLSGPARAFAMLVRALKDRVAPLLVAVQRYDSLRAAPVPAEAEDALAMCRLGGLILQDLLPWDHPLRKDVDVVNVGNWIGGRLNPVWRHVGSNMQAAGLAGPDAADSIVALLDRFLVLTQSVLEEGLRTQGDFDVVNGYSVPEDSWSMLVAALGDNALVEGKRHKDHRGRIALELQGRFSQFVAMYKAAAGRLLRLLAQAPRQRSGTRRVFVEMTPTFGIFAPAGSEGSDQALYRWASAQGIDQALTLPAADKVLLCLAAADRFAARLREEAADPAEADRLGARFQRCVLAHEHTHAALACGLDQDGRAAAGPSLADSWSKARGLNEALAVWMELQLVRGDPDLERLVWDYIGSGTYPAWPYAGAATLESEFSANGLEAIRGWISRLRGNPELAQADFNRLHSAAH